MTNVVKPPCDEGIIQSGLPVTRHCSKSTGRWVLAATILGSSMAFVDGTVVNVALPVLQSELGATVSEVQWIVEGYALFLAALLLVGGALGDRFGRRRVFGIGVALFAVASAACGIAPTTSQLILFRSIQGVGGALLVPGSLALISATFDEEQRGQAIGTWSAFTAITAALGPVLGGWLIESASWRWIFYMNVPIAAGVLVVLFSRVPESRDDRAEHGLDWLGATLATFGLGALVFGLVESANLGLTHPLVIGAVVLGAIGLTGFIVTEARVSSPMMPLNLFQSRNFSGANLVTLLLYAALSGSLFFLPFNLIQVQHYSATAAGAAFLPLILTIFLMSRWAGGLVQRYGAKRPLVIGPAIAAVGYLLMILPGIGGSYWTTFFPAITVLGLGMAISVAPLTTVVMTAIDRQRAGIASGVNNAVSRTSGLLAVAIMGVVALIAFNRGLDIRLEEIELSVEALAYLDAGRIRLAGMDVPPGLAPVLVEATTQAIDASFVSCFRLLMAISAGLAMAGSVAAALTLEGGRSR